MEVRKTRERDNGSRRWFTEKIKLADLQLDQEDSTLEMKEERDITTDTTEIRKIIRQYCQLHANKSHNPGKMETFLETHNLPKLNQEETENLNRPITRD